MTKMNALSCTKDRIAILYKVRVGTRILRGLQIVDQAVAFLVVQEGLACFHLQGLLYVQHPVFCIFASLLQKSLIQWPLNTFCIQRNFPKLPVPTFLSCCNVGVIFQCDGIILNDLFHSPPDIRQRLAVFVIIVSSVQSVFVPFLLLRAFFSISCALYYCAAEKVL